MSIYRAEVKQIVFGTIWNIEGRDYVGQSAAKIARTVSTYIGGSNQEGTSALANQNAFSYEELLTCSRGEMFGPGNPQLPLPPMLMMDRIVEINGDGGEHGKGFIHAEYDISDDRWFFPCHFVGDPVMPGCLGLDAMWQLCGFFLGWMGGEGRGRAIGVGEVKFSAMVTPKTKRVSYEITMKRVIMRRLIMGVADGLVKADGETIYEANDLKVGLFKDQA